MLNAVRGARSTGGSWRIQISASTCTCTRKGTRALAIPKSIGRIPTSTSTSAIYEHALHQSVCADGRLWWYNFPQVPQRSEEHTSELQSLMRISYAVFCLKNKNNIN